MKGTPAMMRIMIMMMVMMMVRMRMMMKIRGEKQEVRYWIKVQTTTTKGNSTLTNGVNISA